MPETKKTAPKKPQDHLPKQESTKATPNRPDVVYATVTIAGVDYRSPELGRMNRSAVKRMKPLMERVTGGDADLEDLWELTGALLVDTPAEVVDALTMDDLKAILSNSQVIAFTGGDAPDPRNLTVEFSEPISLTDEIGLGESSASTGS